LVINPDCAEQVIDLCAKIMEADDCGLMVLDNLANMVTKKEIENSAEIGDPGGSGRVGKKLFNTVMNAQRIAAEKGRAATFVFTNQIRVKIGVDGSELTSFGVRFRNMHPHSDCGFTPKTYSTRPLMQDCQPEKRSGLLLRSTRFRSWRMTVLLKSRC
jgi:hypothetical protein